MYTHRSDTQRGFGLINDLTYTLNELGGELGWVCTFNTPVSAVRGLFININITFIVVFSKLDSALMNSSSRWLLCLMTGHSPSPSPSFRLCEVNNHGEGLK